MEFNVLARFKGGKISGLVWRLRIDQCFDAVHSHLDPYCAGLGVSGKQHDALAEKRIIANSLPGAAGDVIVNARAHDALPVIGCGIANEHFVWLCARWPRHTFCYHFG
jgi:hypothetical protein